MLRNKHLREALATAVRLVKLSELNSQLDSIAPQKDLAQLASRGVRGELLFATPLLLRTSPMLLGYYRLLLGFSKKELYYKAKLARFERMESDGEVPQNIDREIENLCQSLAVRASELANAIGFHRVTLDLLDNLTLLTLGPQLRGSNNTKIGQLAIKSVFSIILSIVGHSNCKTFSSRIELINSSGRKVSIEFSSDPDIAISESISAKTTKKVVAIEIKGGADRSNIWNRLGEAEKSHRSAKAHGFVEFWTIYNVEELDMVKAKEKSPTSTRFYSLLKLIDTNSQEYEDFRDRLIALVGIKPA